MSARLEIRINPQDKEKLEKLAQYAGMSVSELIRSYVIKLAEVEKTLEALETVGKLERKLVNALVLSKPFQELLEKLSEYMTTCEQWVGYHDEKLVRYDAIAGNSCLDWAVKKTDEGYRLEKVEWVKECNEYGDCWNSEFNPEYREPKTLSEVREFLEDIEIEFEEMLKSKIEEIKSIIK